MSSTDEYESMLHAILDVSENEMPSDTSLKEIKSENSFWVEVTKIMHPNVKWMKKINQLALKYYKKAKYTATFKDDLKTLIKPKNNDLHDKLNATDSTNSNCGMEIQESDTSGTKQRDLQILNGTSPALKTEHKQTKLPIEQSNNDSKTNTKVTEHIGKEVPSTQIEPNDESNADSINSERNPISFHTILRGSFHQGTALPTRNPHILGKQCTAMCAVALAVANIIPVGRWTNKIMDEIQSIGDSFYMECSTSIRAYRLLLCTEIKRNLHILNHDVNFVIDEKIGGTAFGMLCSAPDPTLKWDFLNLSTCLSDFFKTHSSGILTVGDHGYSFAVWWSCGNYWLYDSHSKGKTGKTDSNGASFCASFFETSSLAECIIQNFAEKYVTGFTIVSVEVKLRSNKNDDASPVLLTTNSTDEKDSPVVLTQDRKCLGSTRVSAECCSVQKSKQNRRDRHANLQNHNFIQNKQQVDETLQIATSTPKCDGKQTLSSFFNAQNNAFEPDADDSLDTFNKASTTDMLLLKIAENVDPPGANTGMKLKCNNTKDESLHDRRVFKTPKKVDKNNPPTMTTPKPNKRPKRCISNLKPAQHTPETEALGIQLKFSFSLPLQFLETYYVNGKFRARDDKNTKWTDVVAAAFEQGNPQCVLKCDHKVVRTPSKYETILDVTMECKMDDCFVFKLFFKKRPNELIVNVRTFGTFTHYGDKHRRHISGIERTGLGVQTATEHPNEIKIRKIDEKAKNAEMALERGNYNHAPSQWTMQKISSEENLKHDLDRDPWVDLRLTALKFQEEYKGKVIRVGCEEPFYIVWMSDGQIKHYLDTPRPRILHADATGSEIGNVDWAESDIHHYAMVVPGSKKGKPPVCVGECLTERKNASKLSDWINTWQDEVASVCEKMGRTKACPPPDVVVVDYSWPLIHTFLRCFCDLNILQYLESAMKAKEKGKIDYTIVHLCYGHIAHAIAIKLSKLINTECLLGRQVRRLALHLISAMQRTDDLEKAKRLFKHLVVIFDSEKITQAVAESLDEVANILAADDELDALLKELDENDQDDTMDLAVDKEFEMEGGMEFKEGKSLWSKSAFTKEFVRFLLQDDATKEFAEASMKDDACSQENKAADPSQITNDYYIPGFAEYILIYYMAYYPLWSNYLLRLIGYTHENPLHNEPIESYFDIAKNKMCRKKLHLKPGRYLRITVPKVQQRLADAKYDVNFKKNTPRAPRPRQPSAEKNDRRNAIDKWKKGRKSRGKPKGQGAYSTLVARRKYTKGSADRLLIDKIKGKYLHTSQHRMHSPSKLETVPEENVDDPDEVSPSYSRQELKERKDVEENDGSPPLCSDNVKSQKRSFDMVEDEREMPASNKCRKTLFNSPEKGDTRTIVISPEKFMTPIQIARACKATQASTGVKRARPQGEQTPLLPQSLGANPWDSVTSWPSNIKRNENYGEEEATPLYSGHHSLKKYDLQCLYPPAYLGHHCVDRFVNTRCALADEHYARVYAFTTEFLQNIHAEPEQVRPSLNKEAMRSNVINKDILLAPYVKNYHWTLYVLSFKHKLVLHLDSLHGPPDSNVLPYLKAFISQEYRRKRQANFDWSEWSYHSLPDVPHQGNFYDCGVYVCAWAHAICAGQPVTVDKSNTENVRMWIMHEILKNPPVSLTEDSSNKIDSYPIKRERQTPKWSQSVPEKYSSHMDLCSSIVKDLFQSKDGICAMGKQCIAKGMDEILCETHRDYFHPECINDPQAKTVMNTNHSYRCPDCRSTDKKPKHSKLRLKKKTT